MYPVVQVKVNPLDTPGCPDRWHCKVAIHLVDVARLLADVPDVIPARFEVHFQQAVRGRNPGLLAAIIAQGAHWRIHHEPLSIFSAEEGLVQIRRPFKDEVVACRIAQGKCTLFAGRIAVEQDKRCGMLLVDLVEEVTGGWHSKQLTDNNEGSCEPPPNQGIGICPHPRDRQLDISPSDSGARPPRS